MATLPGATYSAPGQPLYQPFGSGADINLSTISVADTYIWEGVTYSTNTVEFHLAAESTSQLSLQTAGLYSALTLDGVTGDLEIYTAGAVNIPNPLNASTISTSFIDTDTISTSKIDLDGQVLTAEPTNLLLNGIPVATISSLSSIADWALDPAISSVNMSAYDLLSTGTGFFSTVRGDNISTGAIFAGSGVFGDISTNTLTVQSTIHVISTVSSVVVEAQLVNTSTLYASGFLSTPDIEVSTINGAQFGNSSITVEVVGVSSLVANSISSIGAELRTALLSTVQFNPSFSPSLNVDLGLGSLFGNLAGAASGAIGVVVGGAALGTGIAALNQSRQTNYINSNAYELVNGTTQLQISTLGTPFSTVYRFVSSVSETTPGEEYFISTIHSPGVAIRSLSDPLNTVSAPTSTIQSFGQWVALDANLPIPSTVSTFQELYTSSLGANNPANLIYVANEMRFSTNINCDGGGAGDGISGADLTNWQNINVGTVFTDAMASLTTTFIDIFQDVKNTGYMFSTSKLEASTLALPSTLLKGNSGYSETIHLNPSTLSTAQVAGSFFVAKGSEVDTNFLAYGRNISNRAVAVNSNFSTNVIAYTVDSNISLSSLTTSTLTFQGVSTINFSTSTAVGTASQPSGRLVMGGNDLDLGQNDLWCQQVRVGAGNPSGSAQTEVLLYSPDALTVRGFGIGGQDRAIRTVSTVNSGSGGYLLDTTLNPPFFSTIAGAVNLMAFFPSTALSTIGVSTISVIPPLSAANASTIAVSSITSIGSVSSIQIVPNASSFMSMTTVGDVDFVTRDFFAQATTGGVVKATLLVNSSGAGGNGLFALGADTGTGTLYASSINCSTNQFAVNGVAWPSLGYFASAYSSTSQTVAAANTSTLATYNATTLNTGGFTIGTNSITVPKAGTYELNVSFQFDTTSGSTNTVQWWLVKNGAAVAQTNSIVSVANNAQNLGNVTIFNTAAAGDSYGWMFYSSDANMTAFAVAAGATPAVPSVIFNIKRLG